MPTTTLTSTGAGTTQQYWDEVFMEYLGKLPFKGYMSSSKSSPIYVQEDLTKQRGDVISMSLLMALSGNGVEGESALEGNEEAMSIYNQSLTLQQYRNAIRDNGALTRKRASFELFNQFRPELTDWLAHRTEELIVEAMTDIGGTVYSSATEAQKDTWLAANSDRVLFGAATGNNASNDHDVALALVDSTTDVMNTSQISLAKRLAQMASPKIRPMKLENGLEFFVLFAHPYCCRDLRADSTWLSAQQYGMPRGMDNPLFTGAIGMWDGVLVVECDKITVLSGVGTSSINVAANMLCGAQSVLMAMGSYESGARVEFVEKKFDYDNQKGVAVQSMFKVAKGYYNSIDHGICRMYSSCVGD